ncbi:hypothetical protein A3767_10950 [Oleiphilus sp. HI0133]|nr:hypothetical protein A3767_10950 [Oleiphilus sp. HI0133]
MSKQVYFFSTCLVEHLFPKVGMDCVALLELAGFEVVLPEYQSCCGQPAYNSGANLEAKNVATKTIDLLSKLDIPVIVPSASCADMLVSHYPRIFASDKTYKKKAQDLAARCHEAIRFVLPHLPELPPPAEESKTPNQRLHISCSARRAVDSAAAWQQAATYLSMSAEEPEYAQECCGFGGTFSVKAPEVSSAMADDKVNHLSANGVRQFVSGDCGCLMHLNGYSEKQEIKLKGSHLATALAQSYGVSYEK